MTKSCSKERARNRPDASKAEDGANELPAKRSKHRRTQRRFPIVRLAPTIMRCRMLLLAAVSASHCTLVIKAILTNLFTKTLYISNIELYLANF